MTQEVICGLHSCKPENVPVEGDVKTFVIEHRPAKNGKKAWIKIKSAGPDYGGEPYLILSASPTGFTDQHGNISFNLEIEPADHPTKGNYPPDARYDTPEKAARNAPQAPPADQNGSEIEKYASYSLRVFEAAWEKAGDWIKTLPVKDAEELSVNDYYDKRMRVAQHIAIETAKIIRRERF